MCNCNNKRTDYSLRKEENGKGMVKVKLTDSKTQVVNGDVTGRTYIFNQKDSIQWVDMRDAAGLKGIKNLKILG
ncbi:MAG TPA: hypothetical protein PKO16_02815 [Bacteroidia bacterium]|nr:hypothetical protein [Bacteroidia bacterium]